MRFGAVTSYVEVSYSFRFARFRSLGYIGLLGSECSVRRCTIEHLGEPIARREKLKHCEPVRPYTHGHHLLAMEFNGSPHSVVEVIWTPSDKRIDPAISFGSRVASLPTPAPILLGLPSAVGP